MMKKNAGFTLIELLIAMVIFIIAIAAIARLFITTAGQFKQQSKITETYIEGMMGFEELRLDIRHAGNGLPWALNGASYSEADNDVATPWDDSLLNNTSGVVTGITAVPRAFVSLNAVGLNGSDVLSVKAINTAINDASQRWTRVGFGDVLSTDARLRGLSGDDFDNNDRVIVISPGSTDSDSRTLMNTVYPTATPTTYSSAAAPADLYTTYIIYGIAPPGAATIRMPFNRADLYVRTPGTMPTQCAGGTGILYKATVNHADGMLTEYPLIDCVADMQVIYRLNMDNDETAGTSSNADGTAITANETIVVTAAAVQAVLGDAAELRNRLKEVRVFILAQDGQRDQRYTFPDAIVTVGDAALGQNFDFAARGIANWQNYRWKVYELPVRTINLK
ncbi:MAG: prepilin-type N-terminal cleavage/methylation domain-containing protein [Nitrospirae bacterium]|nr:prepilin-type N-terminal cleavage/methylation domain-containing protein [Nitrospirota bacterium]